MDNTVTDQQHWTAYDREGVELGRLELAGPGDPSGQGQQFTIEMQQRMYRTGDEDATGLARYSHVIDVYQLSPQHYEERMQIQINGRPVGRIVYVHTRGEAAA